MEPKFKMSKYFSLLYSLVHRQSIFVPTINFLFQPVYKVRKFFIFLNLSKFIENKTLNRTFLIPQTLIPCYV